MVEVFSKGGRTVSIRSDLVDEWRANNTECPSCRGFGYHSICEGQSFSSGFNSWSVWSSYKCEYCYGSGFVHRARALSPTPPADKEG